MFNARIAASALIVLALAGCDKKTAEIIQPRPVRTVTVERWAEGETVSLTGQIRAKDEANLAFRIDGRMLERRVDLGDEVKQGQIIAVLDPSNESYALRTAEANLTSVQAIQVQAQLTYGRKKALVAKGWVPQAEFDAARQALDTVNAQVQAAQAQVRIAQDALSYTVLFGDGPGYVTEVGAQPGEVVKAGQMVVHIARDGPRDAVFGVPEEIMRTGPRDPLVRIALTNNPDIKATGRVREVSPQANPTTRTYEVKVGIIDPPPAMALGATVTGSITLAAPSGVEVPPSALTEADGRPAVWVVDPKSETVSLRKVDVLRYDEGAVVISNGLGKGDIVVTAGVQVLRPDQKVRLLKAA